VQALIAAVAHGLPDYRLFSALPGAGSILAPRLLVAFGEERQRYASAAQLQQYSGIAPVVERSGNKCWIHWRWACSTFLRQTFIEWAGATIPRSFWAAAYYRRQLEKGCSHQVAVRAQSADCVIWPITTVSRSTRNSLTDDLRA
jgi:transposase